MKALSFVIEVVSKDNVFNDSDRMVIIRNVNGQVLEVGSYDDFRQLMDGVFDQIMQAVPSPSLSAEKQS